MCHTDTAVVSHHLRVQREDCLIFRPDPAHLSITNETKSKRLVVVVKFEWLLIALRFGLYKKNKLQSVAVTFIVHCIMLYCIVEQPHSIINHAISIEMKG